ncbi:MAG: hypothetical protein QF437_30115, partial [Planctomycetota bacterium]|nr:hypothetical protein [Planctomycetota bacterium]
VTFATVLVFFFAAGFLVVFDALFLVAFLAGVLFFGDFFWVLLAGLAVFFAVLFFAGAFLAGAFLAGDFFFALLELVFLFAFLLIVRVSQYGDCR